MVSKKIIILSGVTASGKTAYALECARKFPHIEIINADSLLVYKEFNIGTAKPTPSERIVPHHLIDHVDPNEEYTLGRFVTEAHLAISEIESRNKIPMIVGGTGFYLKGLLYGTWDNIPPQDDFRLRCEKLSNAELYDKFSVADPTWKTKIHPNDRYRLIRALEMMETTGKPISQITQETRQEPDPRFYLAVMDRSPLELNDRIHKRTEAMLEQGLIEEARALRTKYPHSRALQSVGYKQVLQHLDGIIPEGRKIKEGLEGLKDEIHLATRQLVKKQRTWFRGESASHWFTFEQDHPRLDLIIQETIESSH